MVIPLKGLNSYTPPKYDYTIITNSQGRNIAVYIDWKTSAKIFIELKTLREKNDLQTNKEIKVSNLNQTNIIINKVQKKLNRRKKFTFFGIGTGFGILLSISAKIAINSLIN